MKLLHNDKMALAWAIFVELGVHALFAFQAFLLGSFLGELALVIVFGPMGAQIGAWALAIFVFGAAFQAFVLGEYMREHVEAFETTVKGKAKGSYIANWQAIRWLVSGIELASLVFRCYAVIVEGHYIQALIILFMGVILLWYAFAQAKVIHASVNRPVEYDAVRAQNEAGHSIATEMLKLIPKMSIEQKKRVYNGDATAIDEMQQSNWQKKNEKLRPKEEKIQGEQERQESQREALEKGRGFMGRLLGPSEPHKNDLAPFQTTQANGTDPLSRNGRN